MQHHTQDVPVLGEYAVIVVGGGTTGVTAAVAAARNGAKTALVEYYGFLGGNAATGLPWIAFHNYQERRLVVKGIPLEMIERLRKVDGASEFHLDPIVSSVVWVNPSLMKMLFAEMIVEEQIDPYLHSLATDVEMEGDRMTGVFIQNKQGRQFLKANVVVDCTDTGDIAVLSGAEYEFGRRHDSKVQASSYIHIFGGIDAAALIEYFEKYPDQMRPHPIPEPDLSDLLKRMHTSSLFVMGAFPKLIADAKANGLDYDRDTLIGVVNRKLGLFMSVASRVENVNLNDVKNISRAELKGLRQTRGILDFLHNYMPGGQHAYLVGSGHQIGVRESRHVLGDYYLTGEDLMQGKQFEDVVGLGSYFLDIHSPDHSGLEKMRQPPTYQIPYRCLLPKGIEHLLIAGRAISADHDAMSSTRDIPISATQGQAAGTAAALAAKGAVAPRQLDVKDLQNVLREQGAELES